MTEAVFVDSFTWIAVINKSDNYHEVSLKTFEVMRMFNIKKAFTNDKHFKQAGYSSMVK